jgi:hypothetical protein
MLEGLERLPGGSPQGPDERAVVLVRDLAGPVVELELFERGQGAVALFQEPEARLLLRIRRTGGLFPALPQERARDEDDARGRQKRAEGESDGLH